jgi:hypothetical protein
MIRRSVGALVGLGVGILLAACGKPERTLARVIPSASDSAFRAAAREATLAFVGTVIRRGATTDPAVRPTRLTTVVRADSVLRMPPGAGDFAGDTLTLISTAGDTVGLVDGRRATFFAYGLGAGETLILRGTFSFNDSTDSVRLVAEAFRQSEQLDADEALARLARRADLVVRAIVGRQAVVAIPDSIQRRYGNERSPAWWQAVILNAGYFGGDSTLMDRSWDVFYPVSAEEDSPYPRRLTTGDTMIFLLRRAGGLPAGLLGVVVDTSGRFFVFDSAEVLRQSDSARVRRVFPPVRRVTR